MSKEPSKSRVYLDLVDEASQPANKRKKVLKTRGGSSIPRRYHMDDEKAKTLLEEFTKTGEFHNPYRSHGRYWAFVQALVDLGINETHLYAVVRNKMKALLTGHITCRKVDGWESFEHPVVNENAACSKDTRGRIIQNAHVLQRLTGQHPYGWKLAQLHACIDILDDGNGCPAFCLNTKFESQESVEPTNQLKHKPRKKQKLSTKVKKTTQEENQETVEPVEESKKAAK